MHPSALLLIWLATLVAVQFAAYPGLLLLLIAMPLFFPASRARAASYFRRTRWLFLTLWLIMAYNTPGDAYLDIAWAPTYEGLREANLGVLRLAVILVSLAGLLAHLGRAGLMRALWGLLLPLRACGIEAERVVVRLALVMEGVETLSPGRDWRKMLEQLPEDAPESVLSLTMGAWRMRDGVAMLLAGAVLMMMVSL